MAESYMNNDEKRLEDNRPELVLQFQGISIQKSVADAPESKPQHASVKPELKALPPVLSEEQLIEQLKSIVKMEIEKCPVGMELEVLDLVLRPDLSILNSQRMQVREDLMLCLQQFCMERLHFFGSTVIGVAFRGSDLDIYVSIAEKFNDTMQLLTRVKCALENSDRFHNFNVVGHARIPIIKCVHIRSGLKCDLNFSNEVGVYNSKIMAHLLNFDSRIRILAVIIKFWMKSHYLIGSQLITSYCTLWFLFFYLQQLKNPLLPPIEVFQRGIPSFFIGTANLAFNFQLPNLLHNTDRISRLLLGFFEFYDQFEFENQFISPLFGQAFPRKNFEREYPQHFRRYREILNQFPSATPLQFGKPICLQDPFDICDTKPGRVTIDFFKKFKGAIANAARICREELMTRGESKKLLLALFDSDIILPKNIPTLEYIQKYIVPTDSATRGKSFKIIPMNCEIETVHRQLCQSKRNEPYNLDSSEIGMCWTRLCIHYLLNILKNIFGFEFSIDRSTIENNLNKVFYISATMDVFDKRKITKLPNLKFELEKTGIILKGQDPYQHRRFFDHPLVVETIIRTDLYNSRAVCIDFHYMDKYNDEQTKIFLDRFASRSRALIFAYFDAKEHFSYSSVRTESEGVTKNETAQDELDPVEYSHLSQIPKIWLETCDGEISDELKQRLKTQREAVHRFGTMENSEIVDGKVDQVEPESESENIVTQVNVSHENVFKSN